MMPRGFLLHVGPVARDCSASAQRLAPYGPGSGMRDLDGAALWTNGPGSPEPVILDQGMEFFLFGERPSARHTEAALRFMECGVAALSGYALHGAWVIREKDTLHIYSGGLGEIPVYYCRGDRDLLVATEIKALAAQDFVPVRPLAARHIRELPYFPDSSATLSENVFRLVPGHVLEIGLRQPEVHFHRVPVPEIRPPATVNEAAGRLYAALEQEISEACDGSRIGIPLSGGCDSAAVAGIAVKHARPVNTYTIGTSRNNEFGPACETARHLGTVHRESVIGAEALLPAILEGIYYNELADPLYAIGYAGLYFAFRAACGTTDRLLTGYGADLTLSNFLGGDPSAQNAVAAKLLARTAWTGELHAALAARFGLEVRHPFLSQAVSGLILSMPVNFRTRLAGDREIDKYVEKLMIADHGLMPTGLINREKQALHTGAGIPGLFEQEVKKWGDPTPEFNLNFLLCAWKQLIFNGVSPDACDIGELITESLSIS